MTKPLLAFVILCFILTAYTIYGGTVSGEQLEVRNYIENYFDNINEVLSSREFDLIEAESIKHNINNIKVEDNTATVDLSVTGIDNTQLTYELTMYHVFVRELATISNEIVNLPNSRDIYEYLIKKNLDKTKNSDLILNLEKINSKWKFTDESAHNLYNALRGVNIEQKVSADKAYKNLESASEIQREKYSEEGNIDISFIQYWINYLKNFIYSRGYVTEFPFEQQVFEGMGIENSDIRQEDVNKEGKLNMEVIDNLEEKNNSEDIPTSMEDRLREIVLETIEDMKESVN